MKTYDVGTHKKHLSEALLMSTHNMFSWRNITKTNLFKYTENFTTKMIIFR